MAPHELSQEDRSFRSAFEACTVTPLQFNHEAHVRLAYVYLVESGVESAVQRMRETLLHFLERNGIPRSKFPKQSRVHWCLPFGTSWIGQPAHPPPTLSQRIKSCSTAR